MQSAGDDDDRSRPDRRLDASRPTVGANCRGIVESSRDRGAIRLGIHADGREKMWGEERSGIPVTGLHTVYPASDHTTVA